jgi:hypothetical protein
LRDLPVQQMSRHNIQNDEFRQHLCMIKSQAKRDASNPGRALRARIYQIPDASSLPLDPAPSPASSTRNDRLRGRLAAVSIAAQIRHHDKIIVCQGVQLNVRRPREL